MGNFRIAVILGVLALAAVACATPASSPIQGAAHPNTGIELIGTLAPLGSFEWKAAPTYTQNAALRRRAAGLLRAGRIDVAAAQRVQERADLVRSRLDQALAAEQARQNERAEQLLDQARAELVAAATELERSVR